MATVLVEITNETSTSADGEYTIEWNDETSGTFRLFDGATEVASLDVTTADTNAVVPITGLTASTTYNITFEGDLTVQEIVASFTTLA